MKKILLISITILILSACTERNEFEQAVLEQVQKSQDLKDYNIDPEKMTQCILDLTNKTAPGLFPFQPQRKQYYLGMVKLLSVSSSDKPKDTLQEGRAHFESPKKAMQAMMDYSKNNVDCLAALINDAGPDLKDKKAK